GPVGGRQETRRGGIRRRASARRGGRPSEAVPARGMSMISCVLLRLCASAQVVEARAVVPEDLRLRLVADSLQVRELLDRRREQSIRVRVVGGDDDTFVADRLDHLPQRLLVGVGGDVALAEEILARGRGGRGPG